MLIVAINSDISVRRLKGKKRPYNNLKTRLTNLSKITEIDYIIYFHKFKIKFCLLPLIQTVKGLYR